MWSAAAVWALAKQGLDSRVVYPLSFVDLLCFMVTVLAMVLQHFCV